MPLDFTKPVTTGNYSTDILPPIRDSQTALSQMLSPDVAGTLTGTPTGAVRRNNASSGLFERFNGSSWVAVPVNGVSFDSGSGVTSIPILTVGTGPLTVPGGSVAAPSLRFTTNLAGIYSAAARTLSFALNGVEHMRLNELGLGLGIVPSERLHTSGNIWSQGGSFLLSPANLAAMAALGSYSIDANNGGLTFSTRSGGVLTARGRVTEVGSLLLGHTTALLAATNRRGVEINGTAEAILGLARNGVTSAYLFASASALTLMQAGNLPVDFGTNNAVRFTILGDGTYYFRGLTSNGSLFRIGTNTGSATLGFPVAFGDGESGTAGTNKNYLRIGRFSDGTAGIDAFAAPGAAADLAFGRNGVVTMRLTAAGDICDSEGYVLGNRDMRSRWLSVNTSLIPSDRGRAVVMLPGSNQVSIGDFTVAAGSLITIYNNTGVDVLLFQVGSFELRWFNGAGVSTGHRTMPYGSQATIWYLTTGVAVIAGTGLR